LPWSYLVTLLIASQYNTNILSNYFGKSDRLLGETLARDGQLYSRSRLTSLCSVGRPWPKIVVFTGVPSRERGILLGLPERD
jgi:hypothetical protein